MHGTVLIQLWVVIPPPALLMLVSPLVRLLMGLWLLVALAPPVPLSQLRPPAGVLIRFRLCLLFRTDRNIDPNFGVDSLSRHVLLVLFHVVNSAAATKPARP